MSIPALDTNRVPGSGARPVSLVNLYRNLQVQCSVVNKSIGRTEGMNETFENKKFELFLLFSVGAKNVLFRSKF